jgi:hypothetical protein
VDIDVRFYLTNMYDPTLVFCINGHLTRLLKEKNCKFTILQGMYTQGIDMNLGIIVIEVE